MARKDGAWKRVKGLSKKVANSNIAFLTFAVATISLYAHLDSVSRDYRASKMSNNVPVAAQVGTHDPHKYSPPRAISDDPHHYIPKR